MKKILLTGATGMIGKKVVERLLDLDYQISYLSTDKSKLNEVFMGGQGYYWNPYKAEFPLEALEDVEVIIHLAGSNISGSWSAKGKEKLLNSRIVPTEELFRILKTKPHKVKQIICASAIGIYANTQKIQNEEHFEQSPGFLGRLVEVWEKENLKFKNLGISVALIRTGLVLDQYKGVLPELVKPLKFNIATVFGNGKQGYSWIHHKDLVSIFIFVLQHQKDGIYNAVGPQAVSNEEFMEKLIQQKARGALRIRIPKWVLKCGLGDKSMLLTEGQYVSSEKIQGDGFVFEFDNLPHALLDIYA